MSGEEKEVKIDISPDAIISCIQEKRMRMLLEIEQMDKNKRYLMNELAETAVACKKIKSDEEISKGESESATEIAKALASLKQNPFHVDQLPGVERKVLEAPVVPPVVPLPGETGVELEVFDYNTIMQKEKEG